MKIAFLWHYDKASEIMPNWRDGLRAAIEELEKDHQVDWYLDKKLPNPLDYDFILVWDDSNTQVIQLLGNKTTRMGLCLTTDPTNIENLKNFDAVYCESDLIFNEARKHGIRAIKAFGTDSNFFTPDDTEKTIEYFYPATFSPWKNHLEVASLGNKLTCIGTIQPDGFDDYKVCQEANVNIEEGYFPAEYIRDVYRKSKKVIISAVHGSERTVLEALSMNIPVETTYSTNPKVKWLLNELTAYQLTYKLKTSREFILDNYSPEVYAKALLKGMKE